MNLALFFLNPLPVAALSNALPNVASVWQDSLGQTGEFESVELPDQIQNCVPRIQKGERKIHSPFLTHRIMLAYCQQ
jgi:hypothetical protein